MNEFSLEGLQDVVDNSKPAVIPQPEMATMAQLEEIHAFGERFVDRDFNTKRFRLTETAREETKRIFDEELSAKAESGNWKILYYPVGRPHITFPDLFARDFPVPEDVLNKYRRFYFADRLDVDPANISDELLQLLTKSMKFRLLNLKRQEQREKEQEQEVLRITSDILYSIQQEINPNLKSVMLETLLNTYLNLLDNGLSNESAVQAILAVVDEEDLDLEQLGLIEQSITPKSKVLPQNLRQMVVIGAKRFMVATLILFIFGLLAGTGGFIYAYNTQPLFRGAVNAIGDRITGNSSVSAPTLDVSSLLADDPNANLRQEPTAIVENVVYADAEAAQATESTPSPTPSETPSPTNTNTPTTVPTETATSTDEPTQTNTEIPTATETQTPIPTETTTPTTVAIEETDPTKSTPPTPLHTPAPDETEETKEAITTTPSATSTEAPIEIPTDVPTETQTESPTTEPTITQTDIPTQTATAEPTAVPTETPAETGTLEATAESTQAPTEETLVPTAISTEVPTEEATVAVTETTPTPTDSPETAIEQGEISSINELLCETITPVFGQISEQLNSDELFNHIEFPTTELQQSLNNYITTIGRQEIIEVFRTYPIGDIVDGLAESNPMANAVQWGVGEGIYSQFLLEVNSANEDTDQVWRVIMDGDIETLSPINTVLTMLEPEERRELRNLGLPSTWSAETTRQAQMIIGRGFMRYLSNTANGLSGGLDDFIAMVMNPEIRSGSSWGFLLNYFEIHVGRRVSQQMLPDMITDWERPNRPITMVVFINDRWAYDGQADRQYNEGTGLEFQGNYDAAVTISLMPDGQIVIGNIDRDSPMPFLRPNSNGGYDIAGLTPMGGHTNAQTGEVSPSIGAQARSGSFNTVAGAPLDEVFEHATGVMPDFTAVMSLGRLIELLETALPNGITITPNFSMGANEYGESTPLVAGQAITLSGRQLLELLRQREQRLDGEEIGTAGRGIEVAQRLFMGGDNRLNFASLISAMFLADANGSNGFTNMLSSMFAENAADGVNTQLIAGSRSLLLAASMNFLFQDTAARNQFMSGVGSIFTQAGLANGGFSGIGSLMSISANQTPAGLADPLGYYHNLFAPIAEYQVQQGQTLFITSGGSIDSELQNYYTSLPDSERTSLVSDAVDNLLSSAGIDQTPIYEWLSPQARAILDRVQTDIVYREEVMAAVSRYLRGSSLPDDEANFGPILDIVDQMMSDPHTFAWIVAFNEFSYTNSDGQTVLELIPNQSIIVKNPDGSLSWVIVTHN